MAVERARKLILETKQPVLIESHCYRIGDHSTSDYSQMYRTEEEMKKWKDLLKKLSNPITRLELFMKKEYKVDLEARKEEIVARVKTEVRDALKRARAAKLQPYAGIVEDVYEKKPKELES